MSELTLLVDKLQKNADKVQKNIYDIEQNLNKVQSHTTDVFKVFNNALINIILILLVYKVCIS